MQTNTDKITLGSLVNRITSPTPAFWLTLRKLWGWAGGAATTIIAVDHEAIAYLKIHLLPAVMVTIAKIIALPAVTTWVHTFLAKQPDPQPTTPASNDSTANQN